MNRRKDDIIRKKEQKAVLDQSIVTCSRCSLSSGANHILPGEGSLSARLFFIAQAPGEIEDREGQMCIGPSGTVFRDLIREAGVSWSAMYRTNLLKCRLPGNRRPKAVEIEACTMYLRREISLVQPDILVPLGFYAARSIFREYQVRELSKDDFVRSLGELFPVHAASMPLSLFPLAHPATILHRPELAESVTRSYSTLSVLAEPCKWHAVCPIGRFTRSGRISDIWIKRYCFGDWSACVRYAMEERGEFHPDTMLPDGTDMVSLA